MEVIVQETYEEMSRAAARVVARTLNAKPNAVLGLLPETANPALNRTRDEAPRAGWLRPLGRRVQ